MDEKPKRSEQPTRSLGFFRQLLEQLRLSWALLTDGRVPVVYKVIPIAAIAYVVSPIDLVPDVIPILGQLDDLGLLMLALSTFNSLAPADVVAEHLSRLRSGKDQNEKIVNVKAKRGPTTED